MPESDPTKDVARAAPVPVGGGSRRARPIYRVFVSSTWLDLQPERRALMDALNRMEEMRFVGMEFFGNRPDDTHDASIDQVDKCEVFIGIIGFRYGSGITEAEYRRARELGLPCFVYFKKGQPEGLDQADNDPALAAKLAAFKQDLWRDHTVKEVGSPEELAANATADLHNWVASRWISLDREAAARPQPVVADADRTNILRLLERIEQDWIKGVLEASLHHRAWLELGLDWREDAVEHPWDRIVIAPNRPIQTLSREDSITGVFDTAQHTLLVLGEPGAGKTTTVLELARDLIARASEAAAEPAPVVLALSTWRGQQRELMDWLVAELGLRYQVPKRVARAWLEEGRLVLILDGLDEVTADRRDACVEAINAFEQAHHPRGLAVTCRVAEYDALGVKLRLRSAICLQPLTADQIERYFKAAGASLDPLRLALRDDAGLRELARSPLMLSVMTMAWRDAPAETTAPFATAQPLEKRRRQLFDAYVQTALQRRGKIAGHYTPGQTTRWLTWLARRMKENGHTLFAVEQLQPGWLGSAGRQFGYFMATRLLGTLALALPFFLWSLPAQGKAHVAFLSLLSGGFIGVVDYFYSRREGSGQQRAMRRFWTLFLGLTIGFIGWMVVLEFLAAESTTKQANVIYLFMVGFSFCAQLDVRGLDVKPAASMSWSWRKALERALLGVVATTLAMAVLIVAALITFSVAQPSPGGKGLMHELFTAPFFAGLATGVGLVVVWWIRRHPRWSAANAAFALTLLILGGSAVASRGDFTSWAVLFFEAIVGVGLGVFGGFAPTLIDPARGRHAGAWFWLRVPVLMLGFVSLLMMIPGLIWIYTDHARTAAEVTPRALGAAVALGGGCGLVAFLRFGGFNGVQHFFLRWLLGRTGDFPPGAEGFFNHAAQIALLQKVGFGYRFIHALLLDHFADLPVKRDGST